MKRERVFRVEMPCGCGPYNPAGHDDPEGNEACVAWMAGQARTDLAEDHQDDPARPAPWLDGFPWSFAEWQVFGFASIEQARGWFCRWLERLDAKGFVLAEYLTDPEGIVKGKAQLIFDRQSSIPVTTHRLTDTAAAAA